MKLWELMLKKILTELIFWGLMSWFIDMIDGEVNENLATNWVKS